MLKDQRSELFKQYNKYVPLLITACSLLAYYHVFEAGFIWDDDDYVTDNPVLRDWQGLWRIWFDPTSLPQYYPLVHTTFWVEYQIWGIQPFGYHLVNVLIHSLTSLLVFKFLRILKIPGALFAALLFALHPVHVESVAWITERKNVLSGLLFMMSLIFYVKWRPLEKEMSTKLKYGLLAFLLFIGALMSKSVTFSLPAVVLLLVYWKRGRVSRSDILASLPFFIIGILSGVYTAILERSHVKAVGVEFDFEFVDRILIAGRAVWFYLMKLFIPYPLMFNYPRWEIDPSSITQWFFPIAILISIGLLIAFREKLGRGPLVAALFFGGTLLPALGFFNVYPMRYSFVADHFQYLASLGPIVLFTAITFGSLKDKIGSQAVLIFSILVLLIFGWLTFQQAKIYEGHESLWRDTLKKNPRSWIAMNNLAKTLMDHGEKNEPVNLLKRSLEIRPSYESHLNLGVIIQGQGDLNEALSHYNNAIKLKPDQPAPYNNKAAVLMAKGELDSALVFANKAISIDGFYYEVLVTRGKIYYRQKKMENAFQDLKMAYSSNPKDADLLKLIADAAYRSKDYQEALKWSANALVVFRDDVNVQRLFTTVLINNALKFENDKLVTFCQNLYNQLGEVSKPSFKKLANFLKSKNRIKEAIQLEQSLAI